MKPCYIHGKDGMTVELDGPALSIAAPGQAAVLTPLCRISRLVITGSPACSTVALLACAERGISVTFLRRDGSVRAHLFGEDTTRNSLLACLRDLLDRPDWSERYQIWLSSVASRERVSMCRKLRLPPDGFTLQQVCSAIEQQMEQFVSIGQRGYLQRRLHGLCANLVISVLQHAGLDAKSSRYFGHRLNIPADFADLLSLSLQLPLLSWLSRQPVQKRIEDREVVALFEQHSHRLEKLSLSLTSRLHGFLVELV